MVFEIKEWPCNEKVGKAYSFKYHEKFHGVLETKVGSYRGNHVHPNDQYTLLLRGNGKYVLNEEGGRREVDLVQGEVFVAKAGIPARASGGTGILSMRRSQACSMIWSMVG